ncbi:MAG: hypothetical protein AAGM46_27840, partial [Cyanobacteria bacterium J06582_2]
VLHVLCFSVGNITDLAVSSFHKHISPISAFANLTDHSFHMFFHDFLVEISLTRGLFNSQRNLNDIFFCMEITPITFKAH